MLSLVVSIIDPKNILSHCIGIKQYPIHIRKTKTQFKAFLLLL